MHIYKKTFLPHSSLLLHLSVHHPSKTLLLKFSSISFLDDVSPSWVHFCLSVSVDYLRSVSLLSTPSTHRSIDIAAWSVCLSSWVCQSHISFSHDNYPRFYSTTSFFSTESALSEHISVFYPSP